MSKSLVVVESPAKARTLHKFLGSRFVVKASMGHVRDLPTTAFGIEIDEGFVPKWRTIPARRKVVEELKRAARAADRICLATDPDREGEAIAWHLAEVLGVPGEKVFRVVFHEITKKAVEAAFRTPGKISPEKVEAQHARRILDRIVGYKLSPLLWRKIARGLSAGRVQSVAVRLLVEREREIRAFKPDPFWKVAARLRAEDGTEFAAALHHVDGAPAAELPTEEAAREVVERVSGKPFLVRKVEKSQKTIRALPPFTTSLLQQQASIRLRFSAKKTMRLAQQLYEGIEVGEEGPVGLITYMRTDSYRVAADAIEEVRGFVSGTFGASYLPEKPNAFQGRRGAQEAHEAIRPTSVARTPEAIERFLAPEQARLYRLVWERFVASQMTPARFDLTAATLEAEGCEFVARGRVLRFDGHTRVLGKIEDKGDQPLPLLEEGSRLVPIAVESSRHETQPPPRYTEAALVKALEKKGIGRPSTYAQILSTIQDRGYAELRERKFFATELGEVVTESLVGHFDRVINTEFTSQMEADLDRIEEGKAEAKGVLSRFWKTFQKEMKGAQAGMADLKREGELSDVRCEKCGSPMRVLYHKRGKFLGCSSFPNCRNTLPADGKAREKTPAVPTDHPCPRCGERMLLRVGSRGRFLACSAFPKCRGTQPCDEEGNPVVPEPTGIDCEKCGSPMVKKGSRRGPFLACSAYPKCRNARPLPETLREPPRATGESCEKCGEPMVVRRNRWGKEFLSCSGYPKCRNARNLAASSVEGGEAAGPAPDAPA